MAVRRRQRTRCAEIPKKTSRARDADVGKSALIPFTFVFARPIAVVALILRPASIGCGALSGVFFAGGSGHLVAS
jgi:hypothetical protein